MRRHSPDAAQQEPAQQPTRRDLPERRATAWRGRTAADESRAFAALAAALERREIDLRAHPLGGPHGSSLPRTSTKAVDTGEARLGGPEQVEPGLITVRRADAQDLAAAEAMHQRCSRRTLDRRYHGPVDDGDRYLRHLLSPRFGRTLAATTDSGQLVGLGHLLWDGEESEVALLVEDAWQRRGVGSELLRLLVALAADAGYEAVYAVTQAGNSGMIALMRGLGLPLDYQFEESTVVVSAPLVRAAEPVEQPR